MEIKNGPDTAASKLEVVEKPISELLHHESDTHNRVLTVLWDMIQDSKRHISQREDDWSEVDDQNRLYADLTKGLKKTDRSYSTTKKESPFESAIVIPVSRAMLDTRAGILYSIFMKSDPFVHLEARTGDAFRGARAFESLLQYDFQLSGLQMAMWQLIIDTDKYGLGAWTCSWEEEYGEEEVEVYPIPKPLANIIGIQPEIQKKQKLFQEWNNIRTINPRNLLLDPAVSPLETRKMLYIGHSEFQNWLFFYERQIEDKRGPYFNIPRARTVRKAYRRTDAAWHEGTYSEKTGELDSKYPDLEVHYVQWKMIPKDWGLSESMRPERWQFVVVGDGELIIRAHKLEYAHDDFTYRVGQFDPDLHAPFTMGQGSSLIGGHNLVNWLIGSHVTNIKKTVNDQLVYNDDLLNSVDMNNPAPGRRIRLTQRGKLMHERGMMTIDQMYGQLRMTDITQGHMETAQGIYSFLQRMAATPDTMQGAPLPTKRTLGEIQGMSASASVRLGISAELLDVQVVMPMVQQMIANRQQFMSMDQMVRLTGRKGQMAGPDVVSVNRGDIAGQYDYIAHTPTVPPDPSRSLALWMQIAQMLFSSPLMGMQVEGKTINPMMVFQEILTQAGVEYFENFMVPAQAVAGQDGAQPGPPPPGQPGVGGEMKAEIMSNEEIEKGVQAGNLAPIG